MTSIVADGGGHHNEENKPEAKGRRKMSERSEISPGA
jgi:hypothetical protein